MQNKIYMDNAATTRVKKEVLEAMAPFFTQQYGNASSIHAIGREAKQALDQSRQTVADCLGVKSNEIFFTGSGTESDNWAIFGAAYANQKKGRHIITSKVEHHAVLHACEHLSENGFEVTYVGADKYGRVDVDELKEAIRDDTILITVMYANNEVGTLQPIEQIGQIANEHGILFHTDAVQVVGALPIDIRKNQVDLLSLSAHKFHGPKGVGVLVAKNGKTGINLMHGGAQESSRRPGTENIPNIVGLAKAMSLAYEGFDRKKERIEKMRDEFIHRAMNTIDHVVLNGHPKQRLPNNINISFKYVEGESLLLMLDAKGICASSGSACTSGSLDPSHVLLCMGLSHETAHGSIRFSLSEENTMQEVDYVIDCLGEIVPALRRISPLYQDRIGGR